MNPRARVFLTMGVVCLGGAVGAWFYSQKAWNWILDGPAEVKTADLAKIDDAAELPTPFVKFTPDKIVPTDLFLIKGNTDVAVGQVYLVKVGDRWLISILNPKTKSKILEGELRAGRRHWSNELNQIQAATTATHGDKLMAFDFFAYDDWKKDWKIGFYFILGAGALGAIALLMGIGALGAAAPEPPPEPPGGGVNLRTFNLPRS
ncbi:MAG: hypothetical protein AB7K24_33735 [Gemmataceae bacterium]